MNQRSIAARLVTQLLKLRYTHLIRQAWEAVRVDYSNHGGDYGSSNNDTLNNTAEALIILSRDDEHFGDLVCAMVDTLPHDDSLSLAFFFHILELIALPSADNAAQLSERSLFRPKSRDRIRSNSAVVWMMLAQRLAGKIAAKIFTEDVHNQLVSQLEGATCKHEQLVSLLALERFAITRECKQLITEGRTLDYLRKYLNVDTELTGEESTRHNRSSTSTTSTSNTASNITTGHHTNKSSFGIRSANFLLNGYHQLARATSIRRSVINTTFSVHSPHNSKRTRSDASVDTSIFSEDSEWKEKELQFCATWALGHGLAMGMRPPIRPVHDRPRVMLDVDVAIGRWKISPDWLEIRNDHTAFATIWTNCPILLGTWYYEVTLITSGIMQIGWTSLVGDDVFECDEGIGVGDTIYSLGYDGCRRLTWYQANTLSDHCFNTWKEGDVLGVWIHLDDESPQYRFYLNGVEQPHSTVELECEERADQWLKSVARGIQSGHHQMYPAASFTGGQQARFNFGATPFQYPPSGAYDTLDHIIESHPELMTSNTASIFDTPCWLQSTTTDSQTVIRGKATGFDITHSHDDIRLDHRVNTTSNESFNFALCKLCCNAYVDAVFTPCLHGDVCAKCAHRCGSTCPWCRATIEDITIGQPFLTAPLPSIQHGPRHNRTAMLCGNDDDDDDDDKHMSPIDGTTTLLAPRTASLLATPINNTNTKLLCSDEPKRNDGLTIF
ncbi:hypothetical protein BDF19DRAFT_424410 [Syncephalis fuscata]|nr:hypothetical protein BDF19DRAFT_424410 [Syncephalis fuscata]